MNDTVSKPGIISILFSLIIMLLLIGEAIAFHLIIPEFERLYSGFESGLPILTRLILFSPFLIWLLVLLAIWFMYYGARRGRGYMLPLFFMILFGILVIPVTWYGLYLPLWEMGGHPK